MAENSSRWKPGQSGNPKGRPPTGAAIVDVLRKKLNVSDFWDKVIDMAMKGNVKCMEMIGDRLCGRAHQSITTDVTEHKEFDVMKLSDKDIAIIKEIEDKTTTDKSIN